MAYCWWKSAKHFKDIVLTRLSYVQMFIEGSQISSQAKNLFYILFVFERRRMQINMYKTSVV